MQTASVLWMRKRRLRDDLFHLPEVTELPTGSELELGSKRLPRLSDAPLKVSTMRVSASCTSISVTYRTGSLSQELVPKILCCDPLEGLHLQSTERPGGEKCSGKDKGTNRH